MKKMISCLFLASIISSSAFASTLDCTNLNDQTNILKVECGIQSCVLNSQTEGANTSRNILLNIVGATRSTVSFENSRAQLGVIVTKRGASLENAIMARVFINGELVSTCK
jgi:hypothetical protein